MNVCVCVSMCVCVHMRFCCCLFMICDDSVYANVEMGDTRLQLSVQQCSPLYTFTHTHKYMQTYKYISRYSRIFKSQQTKAANANV